MTVYVNWYRKEIIREEDFLDMIETAKARGDFENDFEDYLNRHYLISDVFEFSEDDKERILDEYNEYLMDDLMDNGFEDFEPYEM